MSDTRAAAEPQATQTQHTHTHAHTRKHTCTCAGCADRLGSMVARAHLWGTHGSPLIPSTHHVPLMHMHPRTHACIHGLCPQATVHAQCIHACMCRHTPARASTAQRAAGPRPSVSGGQTPRQTPVIDLSAIGPYHKPIGL